MRDLPAPGAILYTIGSLEIGGTELRSLEVISELKQSDPGLNLALYVTCAEGGPLESEFASLGVPVVRGRRGFAGLLHLWWLCRRCHVKVLHTNGDTVSGFHCAAAALGGVKIRIAHFRTASLPNHGSYQKLILHIGRVLLKLFSSRVLGACEAAQVLAGVGDDRWSTLYDGVHTCGRTGDTPSGSHNLLFLGRIHPEKRYCLAIDIFEELMSRPGTRASLHIVGPGTSRDIDRLLTRAEASPYRQHIVVHGGTRDPYYHLNQARVLLHPSIREGLPGAVLEALAAGVPVVASDLPGLREIQRQTEGVTLVPHSASPQQWADKVQEAFFKGPSEEISAQFAAGPFLFENHVRSLKSVWGLTPELQA